MTMATATELPPPKQSPALDTSMNKETRSVPSTDEESAEVEEHEASAIGVEVDELATLIVTNDQRPKSIQKVSVRSKERPPPLMKQSSSKTKTRNKSFRLFGKKVKKTPSVDPVPTIVDIQSIDGDVSMLSSLPGEHRPKLPSNHQEVQAAPAVTPPPTNMSKRRSLFSKKQKQKSIPVEDPQVSEDVPSSFVMPIRQTNVPPSPMSVLGAKRREPSETQKEQKTTTPGSSKPDPSSEASKQTPVTATDDDSVEDIAAGIGRKWALFFQRQKGEIDDSSDDDSSQGSNYDIARAIPASDLAPAQLARIVTPSKDEVVQEVVVATPTNEAASNDGNATDAPDEARDDLPDKLQKGGGPSFPWNLAGKVPFHKSGSVEVSGSVQGTDDKDAPERESVPTNTEKAAMSETTTANSKGHQEKAADEQAIITDDSVAEDTPQDKYAVNVDVDTCDECSLESIDDAIRIDGTPTDPDIGLEETESDEINTSEITWFVDSTLAAFMGGVCVTKNGNVEVIASSEEEATSDKAPNEEDKPNDNNLKDSPEEQGSGPTCTMPSRTNQDGIIARRQAQLSALADNISVHHDGSASVEASVRTESASETDSSKGTKRSFKEKLNTIVSKENAAKRESGEEPDESSFKPSPTRRFKMEGDAQDDDSDLDREVNAFFEQLDDESIEAAVVKEEVSVLTYPDSTCFPQRARSDSPADSVEFDEEKFANHVDTSSFRCANVQKKTESKVAAVIDACDVLAACGRPTDAATDQSVAGGSQMCLSGNGESTRDDLDALGVEDSVDPFRLLDFFDDSSLDDSFWSALEEGTTQDNSVRSGSVRKMRQLWRENSENVSVGSSFRESKTTTSDDDDEKEYNDSIFDTVVEEKVIQPNLNASSNSGVVTEAETTKNKVASVAKESKENVKATQNGDDDEGKSKEGVVSVATVDSKTRDKAIEDIQKAMATLKKYANRHGLSEPELLWKIQEEHQKRKGWSVNMAEF